MNASEDHSKLTLGQPVTFTATLTRRRQDSGRNLWVTIINGNPTPGILIGIRTLSNGTVTYYGGGDDEGTVTYRPVEHFTAYLVAHDLRRRPALVLPDHLTIEQE